RRMARGDDETRQAARDRNDAADARVLRLSRRWIHAACERGARVVIFAIALALVLSFHILRRSGLLAPASVFTWICTMSMITFYVIGIQGFVGQSVSHYWHVRNDYRDVAPMVIGFYMILVAVGWSASMLSPKAKDDRKVDGSTRANL